MHIQLYIHLLCVHIILTDRDKHFEDTRQALAVNLTFAASKYIAIHSYIFTLH